MISGEDIKNFRVIRGWSQERLADELGATQPTVARWETEIHQVKPYIADALKSIAERHPEPTKEPS